MPDDDGGEYQPPSIAELQDWDKLLQAFQTKDYSMVANLATPLGYDFVEFTDLVDNQLYYCLWRKSTSTNYWGTYVFNTNPCHSNLIIQSTHPRKDLNTGKQAVHIFTNIGANAVMIAGAKRCNSTDFSICDGVTSACLAGPATEPFRVSDMAHVVGTIYQKTTEFLFDNYPETYFAQLHGFSWDAGEPYVILSNGNQSIPSGFDYLNKLREELQIIDPSLSYITVGHLDLNWTSLLGTTNTQGRYINGSIDPCETPASANSGRFLHIEQERTKLRDDINGWDKMAVALDRTFQDWTLTSNPIDSGFYRTRRTLVANTTLAIPAFAELIAGDSICLEPDFYVPLGSELEARIENCIE